MPYKLDKNYKALDRFDHWDEATRKVIKKRLAQNESARGFSYLSEELGAVLNILTDALIEQYKDEPRVAIAPIIDAGLSDRKEGVKYGNDPWRGQFYKEGLAAISADFKNTFGAAPDKKSKKRMVEYLKKYLNGGGNGNELIRRFVKRALADSLFIYYSQPAAWNKIGFPGPAYPEGYAYLECGQAEEWEPRYDKRY